MIERTGRNAAVSALLKVEENEGYSNIVIDKTLAEFSLDAREASLASALFYGVLERREALDYYLSRFSSRSLAKMAPTVREILRCAAYQVLFLDKIPASAAVNEAVNASKQFASGKTAGFVNGVLRAFLRGKDEVALPSDPVERLCLLHGCPKTLYRFWETAYGAALAEAMVCDFEKRPPVYLRTNTAMLSDEDLIARLRDEGVEAKADARLPGALFLPKVGRLTLLKAFQEGCFHVQDIASQLACHVLNPTPGSTVLDLCAAPGGKTFTMAERMKNNGRVYAFDLYKGKVGLIRSGAKRLGLSCIDAAVQDARQAERDAPMGDYVLCDAPCSGLGIVKRKPEIRYKDLDTIAGLPALQLEILHHASARTKPGGFLLYSTCTLNPAENSRVVSSFLTEAAGFRPVPIHLPAGFRRGMAEPAHMVTLFPQVNGTDGFFLALFQRET